MGKPRHSKGPESDLHAAARAGDLRTVESICNSNPLAVNSRDRHSRTPLHLAAWSGQTEVVRFLCKNKADVGAAAMDDTSAIHFASQKGHLEIVRILLSSGVSVKAANRKGLTPLHYAAQGSYLELIKFLVKKGANLAAKTKSGQTPLDLASNGETRSILVEYEQSSTKEEKPTGTENFDESVTKGPAEENNGDLTLENFANEADEESDNFREKRNAEEASVNGSSAPKKVKVSLDHLLSEDIVQDEEDA